MQGFQRYKIIDLIRTVKIKGYNINHTNDRVSGFWTVYITESDNIYLHWLEGQP
jgi:hypothetical protein